MAVADFNSISGVVEFFAEKTPEDCFLCGKPLAGITTYWHGLDGSRPIGLHPVCAVELGARLCRDGLNAKFLAEGKSPLAGVASDMRDNKT